MIGINRTRRGGCVAILAFVLLAFVEPFGGQVSGQVSGPVGPTIERFNMTPRQKMEATRLKLDKEKRDLGSRLGEIALMSEQTDVVIAESREAQTRIIAINGEVDTVEASLSTMPAETMVGDPASREFNALAIRASATAMVSIAAAQDAGKSDHGNGALGEYQQHHHLEANMFPVEFFARAGNRIEAAAGLTSAPTNVGTAESAIETPVFADSDAAWCGVQQPIAQVGDQIWPEISTRPDVSDPLSDAADVAETDLTVNSELLAPSGYRRVSQG